MASLESGQPVGLSMGIESPVSWQLSFRPRALFAKGFQTSLGISSGRIDADTRSYEGRIIGEDLSMEPGSATAVIMGNATAVVIREEDGTIHYFRTDPATGELEARTQEPGTIELACTRQPTGEFALATENRLPFQSDSLWSQAIPAKLNPTAALATLTANFDIAELTGIDPVSGQLDKYVNRIPEAPKYAASLKDALLLLALDKSATGPNETESLTATASLYLATVSNVAAVYENQLGVRMLVSELIMTPDSAEFTDLPTTASLSDFRSWVSRNRRQSSYGWTLATKFGTGLTNRVLGVAYVEALATTNAVSMCDTSGIWDVLAHELGHNFGSEHSTGGIMNSSSLGGNVRTFFTDVRAGTTSAEDIYQHAANLLPGNAVMRDPEEIPFGSNDKTTTDTNTSLVISPLENDDTSVRNGVDNSISLEEVSSVSPFSAGSVEILGNDIRFTPTEGFVGTAWFSYTLRGDVGNAGSGWLHKADIGVAVGNSPTTRQITMAAGGSYSFRQAIAANRNSIEQPEQARVDASRDNSRLIIIRAAADATGTDSFKLDSASLPYTIVYDQNTLVTQPDTFTLDPRMEQLEFYPLANDEGAGERWLHEILPIYGVGTTGADTTGNALFSTTMRLVSAELLTPEFGSFSIPTHQVVINGRRTTVNRGSIIFIPADGVKGTARIEYRVQDASGRQATEIAEINLLPSRSEILLSRASTASYYVPDDGDVDAAWMLPNFDDSAWIEEGASIGYERSSGFEEFFDWDLEDTLFTKGTSAYLRIPFSVDDPLKYSLLTLRMRYDDGFVAYLNGVEVARANAPDDDSPLAWNATAEGSRVESQATEFAAFDLSNRRSELIAGENILAIHGLNQSLDSSDFLISPELEGGTVGEGAEIIQPTAPALAIDQTVGLLASGRIFTADDQTVVSGQWRVDQVPVGGQVTISEGVDVTMRFSATGDYQLVFAALDVEDMIESEDTLQVTVGDAEPGIPRGASIVIEQSNQPSGLATRFSATVDDSARKLEWKKISGLGAVVISDPGKPTTDIIVTEAGAYTFRLVAETAQIHTFRDITWMAEPAISTLVSAAIAVTDSSATLSGYVAGTSADNTITFFAGTQEGGESPGAWQIGVPGAIDTDADASGQIIAEVDGLLANTAYYFRFAISSNEETIWSAPQIFSTLPVEPVTQILLAENAVGTVFVPNSAADVETIGNWRAHAFDDSAWLEGTSGFGYDTSGTFSGFVATDIADLVFNVNTTLFIRMPFEAADIDREPIEKLTLRIRYDDAFVAYLNGTEVARSDNAPAGEPAWNAVAPDRRDNTLAVQFEEFDITSGLQNLRDGDNLLAILGVNLQLDSRDLLFSPEVVATTRTNSYSRWTDTFSIRQLDPDQDSDGDGILNLHEFAFGLHPEVADRAASKLPSVRFDSASSQATVEFLRRRDADAAGIDYAIEQSPDLISWNKINAAGTIAGSSGTSPAITDRVRVSFPSAKSNYVRLRVTMWK
ncbi:MAG: hypothetical protein ACI9R3_003665 [Verrucomicrobiales bacterium]|jgi:hypothetical protein